MRKTTKARVRMTLSAEKVRELQAVRVLALNDLGQVVGGVKLCDGSSFKCPP